MKISNETIHQLPFYVGIFSEVSKKISLLAKEAHSTVVLPCSLHDLAQVEYSESYRHVDVCTTDGIPLVWWLRVVKRVKAERVYGPDLTQALLANSTQHDSHIFVTADSDTARLLKQKITSLYPKLRTHYLTLSRNQTSNSEAKLLSTIVQLKPTHIWLGIGSPKQLELATYLKHHLKTGLVLCVGAALEFIAGKKAQAPKFIQFIGLEWLFRLLSEPHRLWKRYLLVVPRFLFKKSLEKIRF